MFLVNAAVCATPVLAVVSAPETLVRGAAAPAAEPV
jgi:hypothetical protein